MKFYSSGKLLITGEYLILKGASALAVPLNCGQSLEVNDEPGIDLLKWKSLEKGKLWFECNINTKLFEIISSSDREKADYVLRLLKAAVDLSPQFAEAIVRKSIKTDSDFELKWGFGSSSSLISNVAYWANTDPFKLHKSISEGSGYDVVTARQNGPVFFQISKKNFSVKKATFRPVFRDRIYFVYLGRKQDTAKNIDSFLKNKKPYRVETRVISELTRHLALSKTLKDFEFYMKEHEQLIASVLRRKTLKETRFKNLDGEVKSLGAWGGDFAMLTWNRTKEELINYLHEIKIDTLFSFDELIKQGEI
ncbi:MAG: hypothetical protein JW731_00945 [Bacteroidales bacterium]|nr:hypothetical protein [Bacteroidales bacterium]